MILSLGPRRINFDLTADLLEAGALPNVFTAGTSQAPSPLLTEMVLYNYPVAVVELALEKGADVNIKDPGEQETPLFAALRNNRFALINLLGCWDADYTLCNAYGQSVLSCIDTFNTLKGIRSLDIMIKNGLDPDAQFGLDGTGGTLMEQAVRYRQTEIMITLLNNGADINRKDFAGRTPLMQGINDENTYRLFIANAADLNAQDNEGCTAIMHALRTADSDAIKFIFKYSDQSFDLSLKNKAGETAHTLAENLLKKETDEERIWNLERGLYFIEQELGIPEKSNPGRPRE